MSTDIVVQAGGFESNAPDLLDREVGAVGAAAAETSRIQAMIVSAKKFPRDELRAHTKIMKAFQRPGLAEVGSYSFPRGGQTVKGPSVACARAIASIWGNISSGIKIVSIDDDYVHIKGYANDLETNAYVEFEDKFRKLIFRKNGGWVEPDERDLRELINRRGAILVRNSILQLLPPDIIDDAQATAQRTRELVAKKQLTENRDDTLRTLSFSFDRYGVTRVLIEKKLGHTLEQVTKEELAELKSVLTSIKEGHSKPSDYFDLKEPAEPSDGAKNLTAALSSGEPDPTGQGTLKGVKLSRRAE